MGLVKSEVELPQFLVSSDVCHLGGLCGVIFLQIFAIEHDDWVLGVVLSRLPQPLSDATLPKRDLAAECD